MATGKSPLTFNDLLAYGFLRRKLKAKNPQTYRDIAEATGINRTRATPGAVQALVSAGLVLREGKGWRAAVPDERHLTWFAQRADGRGARFFKVYARADDSDLTATANALYFLMMSLDRSKLGDGTSRLLRNAKSGLAAMLGVDRRSVHRALADLNTAGLFRADDDGLHVLPPVDAKRWRKRVGQLKGPLPGQDIAATEPSINVIMRRGGWHSIPGATPETLRFLEDRLTDVWSDLREAGYWQSDTLVFLKMVRSQCNDIDHALAYLATAFPKNLKDADAYHARNTGRYRCSLHALKSIAERRGIPVTRPKLAKLPA